MREHFSKRNGVSLVELMVGMAIFMVILSTGVVLFQTFTKFGTTYSSLRKVHLKTQAVADYIRQSAVGDGFNYLTTNGPDCSYGTKVSQAGDANIQVCATISDVDYNTRARTVNLMATYSQNTLTKTYSMTFTITNVRGKERGANMYVKVLSATDTINEVPLTGVIVTADAIDGGSKLDTTNGNGIAMLQDVYPSGSGLPITVDGSGILAFHADPTRLNNFHTQVDLGTFTKVFQSGPTISGRDDLTYVTTPIRMYPGGIITGQVFDAQTGAAATGVVVAVYPALNMTDLSLNWNKVPVYGSVLTPFISTTDAFGFYSTQKLIDGFYSIYVMGNPDTYAASLLSPNDQANKYWDDSVTPTALSSNRQWLQVSSMRPVVQNLTAVRRGHLRGQVVPVGFQGGLFRTSPFVVAGGGGIRLQYFSRPQDTFYSFDAPSGLNNFTSTLPGSFIMNNAGGWFPILHTRASDDNTFQNAFSSFTMTDTGGTFDLGYTTPNILPITPPTSPNPQFFGDIRIFPYFNAANAADAYYLPKPLLPVMVRAMADPNLSVDVPLNPTTDPIKNPNPDGKDLNHVEYLIVYPDQSGAGQMAPNALNIGGNYPTDQASNFNARVKTVDSNLSSDSINLYVLKQEVLGTVSGTVNYMPALLNTDSLTIEPAVCPTAPVGTTIPEGFRFGYLPDYSTYFGFVGENPEIKITGAVNAVKSFDSVNNSPGAPIYFMPTNGKICIQAYFSTYADTPKNGQIQLGTIPVYNKINGTLTLWTGASGLQWQATHFDMNTPNWNWSDWIPISFSYSANPVNINLQSYLRNEAESSSGIQAIVPSQNTALSLPLPTVSSSEAPEYEVGVSNLWTLDLIDIYNPAIVYNTNNPGATPIPFTNADTPPFNTDTQIQLQKFVVATVTGQINYLGVPPASRNPTVELLRDQNGWKIDQLAPEVSSVGTTFNFRNMKFLPNEGANCTIRVSQLGYKTLIKDDIDLSDGDSKSFTLSLEAVDTGGPVGQ